METCLQKSPDINLVYTINEPAAAGAYTALKNAGKAGKGTIVSVDGGCAGVRDVKAGGLAPAPPPEPPEKGAPRGAPPVQHSESGQKGSRHTHTRGQPVTKKT